MNSMQKAFLKNFNPAYAIKVTSVDKEEVPKTLLKKVFIYMSYNFNKVHLDEDNGVIYIGKN